jgi:NADH-quinone oxidoreductase subunit N
MNAIIALSIFGIVNLFLGFRQNRNLLLWATLAFVVVALGLNLADWNTEAVWFYNMLRIDNTAINFSSIILVAVLLVVGISRHFGNDTEHSHPAEYYAIMLFSAVGALMMVSYENLIMLFVGLEIMSVSMYVLTGTDKRNLRSNEAALKYFLMGAFATGILLFGIALLYGASASFNIRGIAHYIHQQNQFSIPTMFYIAVVMIMIGMFFKIAAVPFHFWTPDVYEGAPTIFTTLMSTVVKTASFAALYRLFSVCFNDVYGIWGNTAFWMCMLTLIIGNLSASYQLSFKRTMAYSSISHAGYMLLAFVANKPGAESSILFYSMAYTLATVASFGVFMLVSERTLKDGRPNEEFEIFNGLASNNPFLAFVLTVSMLSLAGIPLTAGFWGKFFVIANGFERGYGMIIALTVAILMSAVGIYYYFKAIIAAYMKKGDTPAIEVPILYKVTLAICTILTIVLGVYPDLLKAIF